MFNSPGTAAAGTASILAASSVLIPAVAGGGGSGLLGATSSVMVLADAGNAVRFDNAVDNTQTLDPMHIPREQVRIRYV